MGTASKLAAFAVRAQVQDLLTAWTGPDNCVECAQLAAEDASGQERAHR